MTRATRPHARRPGATLVEAALLMSIFLLFLFGVLEYCRYLLVLHVTTNAARDAARYASVNVDKPTNFDQVDYTYTFTDAGGNTVSKAYPSINGYFLSRMSGCQHMLGYQAGAGNQLALIVFPCDNAKLYAASPTIEPQGGSPAPAWNTASYTDRIAIKVTGVYTPILPSFLFMNSLSNVTVYAVMGSEG